MPYKHRTTFKPTPTAKKYRKMRASYPSAAIHASMAAWEYVALSVDSRNQRAKDKERRAAYARWDDALDGYGSAEMRDVMMRLGPYFEAVWIAFNQDGRDWFECCRCWQWDAIPFICDFALDFADPADHYFPNMKSVEETVAALIAKFPEYKDAA
ncbi:hypothetical protein MARCHEWKA_01530 [Brevundimonas phage vB_BpoS-Marchewka]|uniref:Uncharacterized protein n=1 Tax=Brevundimonas phage vB_BpoS-Marchewka TaxID=2948604 RepID=A0A9E7N5P7_9CAUD|nr:hypothetical protein MARCHEWKA_01530 [Brevundimonas phage vB_BpoS-Marchewka]UTC29112.1 hypothetical protein BAMBUS_00290 [Brevundimonas phage vB_BpoS-Bambus]